MTGVDASELAGVVNALLHVLGLVSDEIGPDGPGDCPERAFGSSDACVDRSTRGRSGRGLMMFMSWAARLPRLSIGMLWRWWRGEGGVEMGTCNMEHAEIIRGGVEWSDTRSHMVHI